MGEQEERAPLKSLDSNVPVYVEFVNNTRGVAEAFWLNFSGQPVSYGEIKPGQTMQMDTYLTHPWVFRATDGFKLRVNRSDVYFPVRAPDSEDFYDDARYRLVRVSVPVYSLEEECVRLIRRLVRKEDVCKLEISENLRQDICREPNLLKEIRILSAQRSSNVHD